jgi:hypothetical protein
MNYSKLRIVSLLVFLIVSTLFMFGQTHISKIESEPGALYYSENIPVGEIQNPTDKKVQLKINGLKFVDENTNTKHWALLFEFKTTNIEVDDDEVDILIKSIDTYESKLKVINLKNNPKLVYNFRDGGQFLIYSKDKSWFFEIRSKKDTYSLNSDELQSLKVFLVNAKNKMISH